MLDPFLAPAAQRKNQADHSGRESLNVEFRGHSLDTASPRPSVGLWIGRLLIRMGEKLTGQDHELRPSRESS
jgi:hypothetical protein